MEKNTRDMFFQISFHIDAHMSVIKRLRIQKDGQNQLHKNQVVEQVYLPFEVKKSL